MRNEWVREAFTRDFPVVYTPDEALRLLAKVQFNEPALKTNNSK
ncbi:MAG: hypothetical protein RBG13Loki_3197, partial [Promethearchaeota archaeon CR_4]